VALERILFAPGVVVAGSNISLPSGAKSIDAISSARLLRVISVGVKATETAADSTTFVTLQDGAGADVTGVKVSHAGGAASDISVPAALTEVAATATKVDGNTITLDVDTTAADLLELVYTPVGSQLKVA
jgi:hypothetical protein